MWALPANGFRSSYGIVTAMFGVTILGCWIFRVFITRLNKKLEQSELTQLDGEFLENEDVALRVRKGFRYLV